MSEKWNWKRVLRVGSVIAAGATLGVFSWFGGADGAEKGGDPEAAAYEVETTGFLYKKIAVDNDSARSGIGHAVTLRGQRVPLVGQELAMGDKLRAATLKDPALKSVPIPGKSGRVRIISVVPSLQTPTCEQQTHYLSEKNGGLSEQIELVTISLDTPEIQGKFAEDANIENVTFLSDTDDAAFGRAHGLLIENPRILTRAVMVVDKENVVQYLQVVPNVSHMPDMEGAFMFARLLVD